MPSYDMNANCVWSLIVQCLISFRPLLIRPNQPPTSSLRYIDTVFLDRQNHDNQINAKCEKNLVHYTEFGCLLLNE